MEIRELRVGNLVFYERDKCNVNVDIGGKYAINEPMNL